MTTLLNVKARLAKVLLIGGCLMLLSANAAFAAPENSPGNTAQSNQAVSQEDLLQKQQEIDSYVAGEGQDELAEQGFQVTTTAPGQDAVEIGITPYSKAHAEFLYEKFGRDQVKVVEGEQAVLFGEMMPAAAEQPSADLLQKQQEIDSYVAGEGQDELAEQGFQVTTTAPGQDAVEIGITPYSEAHAEFLYEKFGRDQVKVVEMEQAQLLDAAPAAAQNTAAADSVSPGGPNASAGMSGTSPLMVIIIIAVLALGAAAAIRRKQLFSRKH
ncbi:hypothetical protein ACFOLF_10845 [Paenibacillus sepulcri]